MNRRHPLPATVYALVERALGAVLLESARPGSRETSSRLFVDPVHVVQAHEPAEAPGLFAAIESALQAGQTAAGFFSYECGAALEPAAAPSNVPIQGDPAQPLAWFGIYPRSYDFDHATGAWADGEPPGLHEAAFVDSPNPPQIHLTPTLDEAAFALQIDRIHEWIRAGDVYQLNYTFPFRSSFAGGAAALYAQLLSRQPVDYAAFVHWQQERHILSFSPELFFRIDPEGSARQITTRPMKGTARRGRTTAEDGAIAEGLRHDAKNRAENVMIVDLLRNDLGRLCAFGSVQVSGLFAVERYPTLWQMSSTVTGTLRPDAGLHDILRALFPCGSITGAPKVRAMQLLAELEAAPRGVYTGAIGFFSPMQSAFNVAIRTLALDYGRATFGVGSGIVIDSTPGEEYRECLLKAEFLTRTTEPFSLIETMLWRDGGYPLLELHLDRLEDSAAYFDFVFDRGAIRAALIGLAALFDPRQPRRVRLLLDADGSLHLEHTALEVAPQSLRVCIATARTNSCDRFLYHKTTQRPLYARAFEAASAAGYADVLFLNQRGEVTEGAISSIFLGKSGRWVTPPVTSGLLPGVYRRHLLATRPEIEERILTLDDLRSADAVYLANAVRGLRRVGVDWEHRPGDGL